MKKLITTAAIIAIMTTTVMAKENKVEVCKNYANLAEHLIINAYDVHIFDTKEYQDKIIRQFKNDSFIKCMQQY